MPTFMKRPIKIQAFKFHHDYIPDWFMDAVSRNDAILHEGKTATIKTLEGDHTARAGDYIIQGVKGELYPCKSDIFAMTYEECAA